MPGPNVQREPVAPAAGGRRGPVGCILDAPAASAVRCACSLATALAFLLVVGCQIGGRHATSQPAVPQTGSAELVAYITEQPFITAEPAYRAIYALGTGQDFSGDFAALADKLRADGLIARGWSHAADEYLNRGTLAYMLCKACRVQSGVNWLLTGLGRYAWRELQYKGIAGDGSELNLMSGGEFVGLLLRAEDYLQRTHKADVPRAELGARETAR